MSVTSIAGVSLEPPPTVKVAFVITSLGTGGAEAMLEKLLLAMPPSVLPRVVCLGELGEVGVRLRTRGVDVQALGMRAGIPSPLAFLRLVGLLRRLAPQVVHTWLYHADLLGGLAARVAGVREVMWCLRGSNLDPAVNRRSTLAVMRLCARLSHWLPRRIACAAVRARDAHVAAGYDAARMVVIPNGFDLTRFRPDPAARQALRDELGLSPRTPLVGMVGRFDVLKNHRGFCDALAHLSRLRPDVHVVMAGQQVDAGNRLLLQWLEAAGVSHRCSLLGVRGDMPRLMAAIDVLALPSLGEAFPNVVGEAMACGVPCVVTDVGDAAAIVGDTGRTVAVGDMSGMAEAIASLLNLGAADRAALAERARDRVMCHFDIASVALRFDAEYRSMLMPHGIAEQPLERGL